eukprot:TRINITY_DN42309_c0_g1_i1.p1 TRINITY_DN42309_c0_g1~~TRINITY_DN42309_c0_g1_i1.p1  ORF type:complete len:306 (-),score=59.49 TRINITY_DN42309_c0_g1_i1:319-1236(-)
MPPSRSPTPGRSATPERSSTPGRAPSVASDSPRVSDEQGSTWGAGAVLRRSSSKGSNGLLGSGESYALFRAAEVLQGVQSAKIRRVEDDIADLYLDDIYSASDAPWQLDRRDINGPHSSGDLPKDWLPDFWVSSDAGKVCFAPVEGGCPPGQYHKHVDGDWQRWATAEGAPGNVGGFHGCCIDTGQPGSQWTLVARLADFGLVMGRDAGLRVEFAALVRNDCEALVASVGVHDECRSLFCVDEVLLPSGKLLLADPAELPGLGAASGAAQDPPIDEAQEAMPVGDGPAVPCGLGAGYYPVMLSRQ